MRHVFFFQPTFCLRTQNAQNASQRDISSQASARSFNVVLRSEHQKKQAWEPFKVIMALLSFKKGVRQKKKIRKSLYFILKKDFLKLYAVLN